MRTHGLLRCKLPLAEQRRVDEQESVRREQRAILDDLPSNEDVRNTDSHLRLYLLPNCVALLAFRWWIVGFSGTAVGCSRRAGGGQARPLDWFTHDAISVSRR